MIVLFNEIEEHQKRRFREEMKDVFRIFQI